MPEHTRHVIQLARAVVGALKQLDSKLDVATVVKTVTIECQGSGMFSVSIASHRDIIDAMFAEELEKFLTGGDDAEQCDDQPPITGGDIS